MTQATRVLILYKRHLKECTVNNSRVPINKRRFWMNCDCPIWIYGRTPAGDIVPRQSTGYSDLKKAQAFRSTFMAEARDERAGAMSLATATAKYLASRQSEISDRTYHQTKLLLNRLTDYCMAQAIYDLADLNADLLESFKVAGLPSLCDTSRGTSIAKLHCFLRHAFRLGWIQESLADKVTTVKAVYDQKEPYTDEEITSILDEALKLKGGRRGYGKQPKTFRLLLELMLETGMRVGDSIRFDPAQLVRGEKLWIYTFEQQKQKRTEKTKSIESYLTDRLQQEIAGCTWLSPKLPFWFAAAASHKNPSYLPNEVYARMQTIGARCGVIDCRPHRLRDTFAVRKLIAGMHLEDVSRLLGHSSVKVTEMYYGRWTSHRKIRLERLLAESIMNPK
jgi:integrase/recombinase XerD